MTILGIDIGGSGIKGCTVDLSKGDVDGERLRIPTPAKSTPHAVASVVGQIVEHFTDAIAPDSPIGITVPAPVVHGKVPFIANLDETWVNCEAEKLFADVLGRRVTIVNDADAAGVAEAHYGAARGVSGLVIMTTLGTGIGSAFLYNGVLIPNTELGHLDIGGRSAESRAAASIKVKKDWSYSQWATRLQRYYETVEMLFSPDLIVVGGGVSKDHEKFLPLLNLKAPIIPAALRNRAGIIGAAKLAADVTN
ncbi:MAG: polyphosphate--glucose phosphotransferase [Propionibacteriaceae bacterium]